MHVDPSVLTIPVLKYPAPFRDDPALGDEVDRRLAEWAAEIGVFTEDPAAFNDCRYGHFAMLTHPDTDDPDRLLLQAQCITAYFAVDDYWCDDASKGADPLKLDLRLNLAMFAMDPAHLVGVYETQLVDALQQNPVLRALAAFLDRVAELGASPAQTARVRHEAVNMFLTMTAEATWRHTSHTPPVWERFAQRQANSFLPCMALIDVIGGYELPASLYASPAVRRATGLAGSVTITANDLYSAAKEGSHHADLASLNLVRLIQHEEACTGQEALNRCARLHDELLNAYEQAELGLLMQDPPQELRRWLAGLRAWIVGSHAWHTRSGRYPQSS